MATKVRGGQGSVLSRKPRQRETQECSSCQINSDRSNKMRTTVSIGLSNTEVICDLDESCFNEYLGAKSDSEEMNGSQ